MLPDWHTWGLLLNSDGDRENQELEENLLSKEDDICRAGAKLVGRRDSEKQKLEAGDGAKAGKPLYPMPRPQGTGHSFSTSLNSLVSFDSGLVCHSKILVINC